MFNFLKLKSMSIFYKLRYRANKKNPQYSGYYAVVCHKGLFTTDAIAEEIQRNCSMKRSDVLAVLAELSEVVRLHVQMSQSVKLDGIGILSPGIRSTLVPSPENFKQELHVKGLRLNFMPEQMKSGNVRVKKVFEKAQVVMESKPVAPADPNPGL